MNSTEGEFHVKMHSFDVALGYDKYSTVLKVRFYIAIVFFIIGAIGNAIILKVMSNPKFSTKPRRILCFSLAVTDMMILIIALLTSTLEMLYRMAFYHMNIIFCKLYYPVLYAVAHVNAWILVLLTFERLIAVFRPFNIHDIFSGARVKCIVITFVIISLIWNSEQVYRLDLIKESNYSFCISVNDYTLTDLMYLKDFITELLVTVIPMLIITPSNIALMVKMYKNRKQRQQMGVSTGRGQHNSVKFNGMIILVTTSFVVLYLPYTLYMFITNFDMSGVGDEIVTIIAMCNPVLNCYLYFLAGDSFKKQHIKDW